MLLIVLLHEGMFETSDMHLWAKGMQVRQLWMWVHAYQGKIKENFISKNPAEILWARKDKQRYYHGRHLKLQALL